MHETLMFWLTVCSSKPFGVRIFMSVAKIMFNDFLRRILFNLEISLRIYYSADYLVMQLTWNSGAVLNKGNFGLRILTTPTRWIKRNNPPSLFKNNIAKHVTFRRYSPPMWNKMNGWLGKYITKNCSQCCFWRKRNKLFRGMLKMYKNTKTQQRLILKSSVIATEI